MELDENHARLVIHVGVFSFFHLDVDSILPILFLLLNVFRYVL